MVASGDKERVRTLLKDTITLLCRNGLTFKAKFNIEALIGVTLDDDDIFLVSINELVKTEAFKEAERQEMEKSQDVGRQSSDGASSGDESVSERRRKRKRKKTMAVKTEPDASLSRENNRLQNDVVDNVKVERDIKKQRTSECESESQSPAAEPLSQPEGAGYEEDDDSGDIVFVKQEQEGWPEQSANQSQITYDYQSQPPGPDVNFSTSLADMNLVPVSANEDPGMLWSPGQQQMSGYQRRSSTVTSDGVVAGDPGDQTQQGAPQLRRPCPLCGKLIGKVFMERHMKWHQGIYPYYCTVCNKGCMSTTQLRGHMVNHTGCKEYKCHLCDKDFRYRTHLYTHMRRIHHTEPSHTPGGPLTQQTQ